MATIPIVVDTDGTQTPDYTSLSAAEAGEQADLTDNGGDIMEIECRSTDEAADTTAVNFSGWTTAAGSYIKVWTAAGHRHDGKWDATAYRLEPTDAVALKIGEDYVRVDGLQLYGSSPSAHFRNCLDITNNLSASNEIRLFNTIFRGHGDATYVQYGIQVIDSDAILKMWNCVVYNFPNRTNNIGLYFKTGTTGEVYNCTFYNSYYGISRDAGTLTVKNNTVFLNTDDFNGTITVDYCASDDEDGTNSQQLDSTNNYGNEFVDAPNGDFTLVSGGVCVDNGTDDPGSGLYSDDIIGTARSSTWDIGAWELVSAMIKNVSDTGGGIDAVAELLASIPVAEVGGGVDTLAEILASIPTVDIGGGVDTLANIGVNLSVSEGGGGIDAVPDGGVEAFVPVISDVGGGVDTIAGLSALVPVAEVGSGTDLLSALTVLALVAESGSGSDNISIDGQEFFNAFVAFIGAGGTVAFSGRGGVVTFAGSGGKVTFN